MCTGRRRPVNCRFYSAGEARQVVQNATKSMRAFFFRHHHHHVVVGNFRDKKTNILDSHTKNLKTLRGQKREIFLVRNCSMKVVDNLIFREASKRLNPSGQTSNVRNIIYDYYRGNSISRTGRGRTNASSTVGAHRCLA